MIQYANVWVRFGIIDIIRGFGEYPYYSMHRPGALHNIPTLRINLKN